MFGVSRRLFATVGALATILVLTTSVVSAADPDSLTSARANDSAAGASATLGAKSHRVSDDGRLDLQHGGGLQPPATDVEAWPLDAHAPASGLAVALATWVLVFVAGVLASLRYMARRSRL
jgi:hypothetical protein